MGWDEELKCSVAWAIVSPGQTGCFMDRNDSVMVTSVKEPIQLLILLPFSE